MARDERALREAAEQSAAILTAAGMPKMPARVLMALTVAEEGGLTALELGEVLGVSAAAISGAVRYLQSIAIVRRVAQPGSRRDRYEVPPNAWLAAFAQERPVYRALADLADAASDAIGDHTTTAAGRLEEMASFYRFLDTRLPALMNEWEQQRKEQTR
ncbi:GbsR/MarR family transcriptional regulator [Arthrobacter bambusae]|uniref:GbsR/MarR family transcriptional regulator n=1 Tax=Arthrobacter bambusae TaxID=1338426 RepID=UPI00278116C9|nr:MarR family transcriptional regulator [Arthrobacter bambusae]MDQ0028256.1 DNA-binding transcriptional regulator GbsR (MarR family) [Arthrobacter bambusae]MDQ0096950.1 DNA-binding transcriptional regulator GbsR (MarR family) [Arthrobacter bambusae]